MIKKLFEKFLKNTDHYLIFLAGTIIGAVFKLYFSKILLFDISILIFFSVVLILFSMKKFQSITNKAKDTFDEIKNQLSYDGRYISFQYDIKEGYNEAIKWIRCAKERIIVISPSYAGTDYKLNQPEGRKNFFSEIETSLREKLNNEKCKFSYYRVIPIKNAKEKDGRLNSIDLNEPVEFTYNHCKEVYKINKSKKNRDHHINIKIRIHEPLPALPSILIVDNKYMSHFITSEREPIATDEKIHPNCMLNIVDKKGTTIDKFYEEVINEIVENAYVIKELS